MTVVDFPRHGQPGYSSMADAPQDEPIDENSLAPGWPEMDELWRLYPSQFNLITGLAGSGKTTFIFNVISNLARQYGARSFIYGPENRGFMRSQMRVMWGADEEGFNKFAAQQCFMQSATDTAYDHQAKTIEWVLDRSIVAVEKDGVDILVIDPWNELERARPKDEMLTDYIGRCLMYMKEFCRIYRVIMIMVAHPTKAGAAEGKIPNMSDVEGSMNWYNKCDNGLVVHRDKNTKLTRVISAKVRRRGAGKRGTCFFTVDENGIFTPQHVEVE